MTKTKKILGIVLALIVLTLVMSISVFAATTVTTEEELKSALTTDGEVTLGGDIVVNTMIEIPSGVTVTLDLNGYAITVAESTGNHIYALNNKGVLTLKDSVGTGSITARGIYNGYNGSNIDETVDGAKMIIESGKYVGQDNSGGAGIFNCAELIINGGTFEGNVAAINNRTSGNVTINNAIINGGAYGYAIQTRGTMVIKNADVNGVFGAIGTWGGTTTIDGGDFSFTGVEGSTSNCVYNGEGSITINGGKFYKVGDVDLSSEGAYTICAGSDVTITDGEFASVYGLGSSNGLFSGSNATVTGGTFDNSQVEKFIDETTENTVTIVNKENVVAKIGATYYSTFDEAIAAANSLTGNVTVEIYGKVEYSAATANLTGAYDTITFVGVTDDAEISITRDGSNGYISGEGNDCTVNFTDLILSKPTGAYAKDAGFMNVYFTVYRVGAVNYTNCTFPDGACAQGCPVTYTGCDFANQTSGEYSLWVYANTTVTVENSKFTGVRGAKMYGEGQSKTGNLVMTNTMFTASVTEKPAIVLTYGESVELDGNTYPAKGTFELDLGGSPNGTTITVDAEENIICVNDNGDCGVLVDGKIYTTVAQAAEVATSGSTVTLLHDSTETVEFAEGVTLDTNGYTAENVTVVVSGPVEVATYDELVAALNAGKDVVLTADIVCTGEINGTDVEIDLNGKKLTLTVGGTNFYGKSVVSNGTIDITGCVASGDCIIGIGDYSNDATLTLNNVNIVGDGYSSAYAILYVYGTSTLNINGGSIVVANDNAEAGGVIKAESADDGKVNITGTESDPVELSFTNAKIGILNGTVVLDNVDLDITGGANAINGSVLTVKNSTVTITDCDGRAITANQGNVVIENSTLDLSNCTEGEIRFKTSVTMTVDANSTISECTIYADSSATEAKVNDVTVVGTEDSMATVKVANGTTTIKVQPQGTLNVAYISSAYVNGIPAIFGEAVGVIGEESFVVKLYCGGTLVGTATLVDNDKALLNGNSRSITWHAALSSDGDTWWSTEWTDGSLKVNAIPDTAELYVDGEMVSTCEVQMNINDLEKPIVAAKVDANGVIEGFVVSAGYLNGVNENKVQYAAALNEAFKQSGNYVLVRDIDIDTTIKVNSDAVVTLDLNGYTIDGTENCNIAIMSYGDLTIKDSSEGKTGTVKAGKTGNTINVCGGTFTLESGNIYSVNNAILIDEQAATVNINGGTITAESTTRNSAAFYVSSANETEINITAGEIVGYNGILLWDNTEINISGGSIDAKGSVAIQGNGSKDNTKITITDGTISGYYAAIYHPQGGELNISGGELSGWTGVVVKGGTVTISGGTITGTGEAAEYAPVSSGFIDTGDALYVEVYDNSTSSENYGTPTVTVTGGTFKSTYGNAVASYANTNNSVEALDSFVSGGTFNTDVSDDICADGFTVEYDEATGTYGVEKCLKGSGTEEDPYLINNLEDLKWFRDHVNTCAQDGSSQYTGKYVKLTADIDLYEKDADGNQIPWIPIGSCVKDHGSFYGTFDGDGHTISNLYVNSTEQGAGFFAKTSGGGDGPRATIKNLIFNNVDVCSTTSHVGGVIGNAGGNTEVSNVKVTGYVYVVGEGGYVGGIVGHGYPDMYDCSLEAKEGSYVQTHYWCAGGIIGYASEGGTVIEDCSVSGVDIWTAYGAGAAIAGLLQDGNTVNNVKAENVEITSASDYCMGYIAGNGECSTVTNVTITNVTATANGEAITSTDAVASVNGTIYFDLQDAIVAAAPNGTVEILRDVTVEEWVMIAESISIGNGNLITCVLNGLTINGNGHTLTINSIESAGNGGYLFFDATKLNINDLTIKYADGLVGGICLKSGTLDNVTFDGGVYGVIPQTGDVTIQNCTFKTNGTAIYFEEERDGLVVTGNTFELADTTNVILLRGDVKFTNNNVVSGRTVNVVSGSPVVTGNDFNDVRVKVYNNTTATVTNNEINNLVFADDVVVTECEFADNTLSTDAQAALDAVSGLKGSGTEADPFLIEDLDDLIWFRDDVNNGNTYDGQYIKLTDSIDLNSEAWTPIGNSTNKFLGTFDGQNNTISNLNVNIDGNNAGLFGFASVIKNVKIVNANVSGIICVGALVGELESSVGTVDNCHVSGNIKITGENSVGGLAGKGYANIKNSSVIGDGTDTSFVQGVYGTTEEGDNIGGIIGHLGEGSTLGVSYSTVKNIKIVGTRKVGGIVGTTARANDYVGNSVDGLVIESIATEEYANANASTTTIGGIIGNYFGSATSGGILENSSVSNIEFIVGNAKSAGALAGGDRENNGGAPVGVEASDNNVELATVTGTTNIYLMEVAAKIGDTYYETLADAVNAAVNGDVIVLLENCGETVTVNKTNVAFTIDGKISDTENVKFTGQIKINVGQNLTVQNVDFVYDAENIHDFIINEGSPTGKNYNTTLTVNNCSFTGNGENVTAAIRTIRPTLVTIVNCSGTGLHSFLQNTGGQNVVVNNLTVTDSKSGLSLGGVVSATVMNSKIDVSNVGYGIRIDAATNNATITIESCEISAFIPVVARNASANVTINVNGTNTMTQANTDGIWMAIGTKEYEANGTMPTDATGKVVVTLNDENLSYVGVYGMYAVAEVNGNKYATLTDAIEAVKDGETVVLNRDVTLTEKLTIAEGTVVTIDLAGKKITTANDTIDIIINGKLTITDSVGGGASIARNHMVCGELVLDAGTIQNIATATGGFLINLQGGKVTINGGAVKAVNNANYAIGSGDSFGTVVINDGTIESNFGCVNVQRGTTVEIKGGTFNVTGAIGGHCVYVGNGTATINGGTFNPYPTDACYSYAVYVNDANANVTINGGTFNNSAPSNNVSASAGTLEIYGGTYADDPTAYLADGYVAIKNLSDMYVVGEKPTATVNDLGQMTISSGDYIIYGDGDDTVDMPLSFVMQFLANQTEDDMETSPYADWYGDFVITFTGIEDGSFTADGCYLAGYYGSFGWVKVPVDGMKIENGVRYPVMLGVGMGQKYDYICSDVKDFRCALYLTPEILEANPNLQVNLELSVVDNSQGETAAANALVEGTNIYEVANQEYDAEDFKSYVAQIGETKYETYEEAFAAAENGDTVVILIDGEFTPVVADGLVAIKNLDGNYVVGKKPTATVNDMGPMLIPGGEYTIYPNGSNTADMPLSFVMQFLADQTEADMETSPYAKWYGDFVITFTGIENDSFTADGCYLAGYYGNFGWVKVPVDGMKIENGVRYPVMLGVGMGQKYDYICSGVQDFKCALYLTPEVLAANPNIKVNLELAVVDNSQGETAAANALVAGTDTYKVTDYSYDAEDFVEVKAMASVTDANDKVTNYISLQAAINAVKDDETITILETIEEGTIKLPATLTNVTFVAKDGAVIKNTTIKSADGNSLVYEGITFDGITFENSSIVITGWRSGTESYKNWTITNCTFTNLSNADNRACVHFNVDADAPVDGFTYTNNTVDTTSGSEVAALYVALTGNVEISGNTIKNTAGNCLSIFIYGTANVVVEKNTFDTWGTCGAGRAIRATVESATSKITVQNNVMICENAPEQFAKVTGNEVPAAVSVNKNYWNGNSPIDSGIIDIAGEYPENYYADEALTDLKTIGYVAQVGDVKYLDLQDAINAAVDGDTVTLLANVEATSAIVINKSITLDGNGYKLTTSASRAINVDTANGTVTTTIKNIEIVGLTGCQRGINIIDNEYADTPADVTLNNVKISGVSTYGVQIADSVGSNNKLTVNNSEINSWIALNINGDYQTVTVTDSKLTGTAYSAIDKGNTIVVNGDYTTVTVNGGSITAITSDGLVGHNCGCVFKPNSDIILNNVETNVAKEGDKVIIYVVAIDAVYGGGYTTLQDALASGATEIKLVRDIVLDAMVTVPANIVKTLDLNGKTISTNYEVANGNDCVICIAYGANLTITGKGTIDGSNVYGAIKLTYTGDNVENGTAKLTVNGGTLKGNYYGIVGNGGRHGTEITVNGGTITAKQTVWGYGIFHPQDGTLTVNGGTIEAATGIEMRGGTLVVNGGEIKSTATELSTGATDSGTTVSGAAIAISQHTHNKPISVTVNGGTLSGTYALYQNRLTKTEGISENISATIAADTTVNGNVEAAEAGFDIVAENGTYTLVVVDVVAQIGSVRYETLAEAFAAAKKGDTITLLDDITLTEGVSIMDSSVLSDITLDGNGKTITLNMNGEGTGIRFGGEWATGVKISDLTITGSAKYALWLNGGTSSEITNVTVAGTYDETYGAVIFYGTHGATLTNCNIVSGFVNGQDDYPLTLVNTTIGTLLANNSEANDGAKVFVDEYSSITKVLTGNDTTVMIDYDSLNRIDTITTCDGKNFVAEVDRVRYAVLADAIANAEADETVKLLANVEIGEAIVIDKAITLDLGEKTISLVDETYNVNCAILVIGNDVAVTITNGTVKADGLQAIYVGKNKVDETVVMYNTKVTLDNVTLTGTNNGLSVYGNANVTINNGSITGGVEALNVRDNATVSVNGTAITCTGTATDETVARAIAVYGDASVTITAGTVNGEVKAVDENSVISITGGTFTMDVTAYCATGYGCALNSDNMYEVTKNALINVQGTTMSLGTDLAINFYFLKSDLPGTDYYAVVKKCHSEGCACKESVYYIPFDNWLEKDNYYIVQASGIAAKEMLCDITVEIYAGTLTTDADGNQVGTSTTQISVLYTQSVVGYVWASYSYYRTDATKYKSFFTMMADALVYGAEAQMQFEHYVKDAEGEPILATNVSEDIIEFVDEYRTKTYPTLTYEYDKDKADIYNEDTNPDGYFAGSNLTLENTIYFNLYFANLKGVENVVYEFTFTHYDEETVHIYTTDTSRTDVTGYFEAKESTVYGDFMVVSISDLAPADLRLDVTCTVKVGGKVVSEVVYSVEDHCANAIQNDTSTNQELYYSIMKYADSAYAYFNGNEQ